MGVRCDFGQRLEWALWRLREENSGQEGWGGEDPEAGAPLDSSDGASWERREDGRS